MSQKSVAFVRLAVSSGVLWATLGCNTTGAELPETVARTLAALDIPPDDVSILVERLDSPAPVLSHLPDVPRNPASVMKLVTTWSALQLLGPAYTWPTEVYFGGDFDGRRLYGDLGIKGYGDPFLVIEEFWNMLRALRRSGLREIEGNLLLDDSYFFIPPDADPGAIARRPARGQAKRRDQIPDQLARLIEVGCVERKGSRHDPAS